MPRSVRALVGALLAAAALVGQPPAAQAAAPKEWNEVPQGEDQLGKPFAFFFTLLSPALVAVTLPFAAIGGVTGMRETWWALMGCPALYVVEPVGRHRTCPPR